jgi:hypothetical protein
VRMVTCSMGVSLDGYIVGPDGGFDWTAPHDEVFRFVTEQIRQVGVHLLGRRLYETMLYWETADQDPSLEDLMLEWAAIWKSLPTAATVEAGTETVPVLVLGDEDSTTDAEMARLVQQWAENETRAGLSGAGLSSVPFERQAGDYRLCGCRRCHFPDLCDGRRPLSAQSWPGFPEDRGCHESWPGGSCCWLGSGAVAADRWCLRDERRSGSYEWWAEDRVACRVCGV